MAGSSQYKTKQRAELLAYLQTTKGTHVTASDVNTYFQNHGMKIGTATIYRQLERLVEAGLVNKYFLAKSNGAYFEYVDKEEHCQQGVCFHCKCEGCGDLIHLKCDEMEEIQHHLLKGHGFTLNPVRTVLYGICDNCSEESKGVEVR